jgi:hypothetical protein
MLLVGIVCVIALAALMLMLRSGRHRSRLNENRAMRDYVRRMARDRSADN